MRAPATQTSPLFRKIPQKAASRAASMLASANMMFGAFPPSSIVWWLRQFYEEQHEDRDCRRRQYRRHDRRALGRGCVKTPARFHTDLFCSLFRAFRPLGSEKIAKNLAMFDQSQNFAEFSHSLRPIATSPVG